MCSTTARGARVSSHFHPFVACRRLLVLVAVVVAACFAIHCEGGGDKECTVDTDCQAGWVCTPGGKCVESSCTKDCAGRECGPDPECGESCGTCGQNQTCNVDGVCIDDTCIQECGSHEDLMRKGGKYAQLFHFQETGIKPTERRARAALQSRKSCS